MTDQEPAPGPRRRMISIYKSPRRDECYLYVDRSRKLRDVPEALLDTFGKPDHVTDMLLTPERKLARADAVKVLRLIEEQGFYLQMPPPKEPYLLDLYRDTSDKYRGLT